MTNDEFQKQYQRLKDHFRFGFDSRDKENAIANQVAGLDVKWFSRVVSECIASGNVMFNFYEAANAQRKIEEAQKRSAVSCNRTQSEIRREEYIKRNMSRDGLRKALGGAPDVWSAIEQARQRKQQVS